MYETLFTNGASWFSGIAIVATFFFMITVLLLFMGGGESVDGGADMGGEFDGSSDSAFKVLSLQSVVAFAMGWGWGSIGAYRGFEWSWNASAGFGILTGAAMIWLLWLGFKAMHDLTGSGNIAIEETLGAEGQVTIDIPAEGKTTGRIRLVVGDRQRQYRATTKGEAIPSRARIRVVATHPDGVVEVDRI